MDKKKKPRKVAVFDVAFETNGNLCESNNDWMRNPNPRWGNTYNYKWEPNAPFADTFEYIGYRGASGGNSHMLFKSVNSGRQVSMFMSDFDEVVQNDRFINKQIVGLFCYCKKGTKQGMRLIFEDNP